MDQGNNAQTQRSKLPTTFQKSHVVVGFFLLFGALYRR